MKKSLVIVLFFVGASKIWAQSGSYFGKYAGTVGLNQAQLERASAIGFNAKVSVDDGLVLGDTVLVKVGIGMSNPRYKLDVKGVFNTRVAFSNPAYKINDRNFLELDDQGEFILNSFKIKYQNVEMWSDRVFEKNYPLMPLYKVDKFIKENKHLPGVPSAEEVVKQGVKVDEMVSKLLEKVEELTLYTIQQQKEIDALKKELKFKK
jgi:hypothetical protein